MEIFDKLKNKEKEFPFVDMPNTATITCIHVLNEGKPILHVSHDLDDGCWQFLCGLNHSEEEARVVSLEYIYKLDNTVEEIANLNYGHSADRINKNDKWIIK